MSHALSSRSLSRAFATNDPVFKGIQRVFIDTHYAGDIGDRHASTSLAKGLSDPLCGMAF